MRATLNTTLIPSILNTPVSTISNMRYSKDTVPYLINEWSIDTNREFFSVTLQARMKIDVNLNLKIQMNVERNSTDED